VISTQSRLKILKNFKPIRTIQTLEGEIIEPTELGQILRQIDRSPEMGLACLEYLLSIEPLELPPLFESITSNLLPMLLSPK
jgi:hypothetical protein